MISAVGRRAERYAARLGDIEAIVTDHDTLGEAFLEAVRRRGLGQPFYGMVLLDDPRVVYGSRYVEQIVVNTPDYDTRRLIFDNLALGGVTVGGVRMDTLWDVDPKVENAMTEFFGLCDAVLVRSFAEWSRFFGAFARVHPRRQARSVQRVLAHATVPVVERVRPERPGAVVWAPHLPALDCALALFGLADFHGELTCVSAGGALPAHAAGTFLAPDDPAVAAALSRASAVVCVDPGDPSDAVAFARLGYGVVAPITSGAHEFAGTVVVWDALDARKLFTALAVAIARPAHVAAEPPPPPRAPRSSSLPDFVPPGELPLVSIVTPTYNRPESLRDMLSCLAAQTYPNLEAVVVNDGGEAIDDVVAAFPFARLIEQPRNMGALRAVEVGRTLARGEYIGLLPDDDWLYPDHVERMVHAMLRSGAMVAHGNALLRYLERDDEGSWRTYGFNNRTFVQTVTPTGALVCASIGGHQMLVHRSVYDTAGGYVLDFDVSDNEIHIRMTQRYLYAFVDNVTSEFRDHSGGAGRQCDFPAALRRMYQEMHPLPHRPGVEANRQATIENVARRPPGQPPFPPTFVSGKRP